MGLVGQGKQGPGLRTLGTQALKIGSQNAGVKKTRQNLNRCQWWGREGEEEGEERAKQNKHTQKRETVYKGKRKPVFARWLGSPGTGGILLLFSDGKLRKGK